MEEKALVLVFIRKRKEDENTEIDDFTWNRAKATPNF